MNDIYEKPELLGAAGGQSGAIDKLEQQLSNALLNKNIGHQTAHSNPSHTPTPSKIKFNLDEAIVVR